MKCKFCGNDLPEESKFCPSCGAPVEPEEKQEQSEQSAEAKQPENQNPYEYGVPGTDNGSGARNENPYISMEAQDRITRIRTSMGVQDRTRLQIIMLIMGLMVSRRSRSMEQPI